MNLREPQTKDLQVHSPAELLGALPHMFGFQLDASLVAVCLHESEPSESHPGRIGRLGMIMRLDLPERCAYSECVDDLTTRVEFERPDSVVLVCYAEEPDVHGGLPRRTLIEQLQERIEAGPVAVTDAMLVRAGRWWSYNCFDSCCPPDGRLLVTPPMALCTRAALGTREEFAATVAGPSGIELATASQLFDRVREQLWAEERRDGAEAVRARTVAMAGELLDRRLAGGPPPSDDEVARVSLGLEDRLARDQVAARPVAGRDEWLGLLVELASRTPDGAAAPICSTLAWVAYGYGDGSMANVALDRALADDPYYSLALMLRDALDRQIDPSHVRSVSAAVWSGFAEELESIG